MPNRAYGIVVGVDSRGRARLDAVFGQRSVLMLAEAAGNDYLPATAQKQTGSGEIQGAERPRGRQPAGFG